MNQTKFKIVTKEIILCLIFVILCIPNLLAIKLSLFRGKIINSFQTYDYARAANIIKTDLIKSGEKTIYVNNIIPITFPGLEDFTSTTILDPYNDNARFVFMQVFSDPRIEVKLNQKPSKEKGMTYFLDGYSIKNAREINIYLFSWLFEKGRELLIINHYAEAEDLFMAAIKNRPFLFNYILTDLRLEDLRWVTDGMDVRSWLNKMENFYSLGYDKVSLSRNRYILSIMNKEVDEYIQCLFCISFLKYISGDAEGSKDWFSKIRFLDNDYQRLYSWLAEVPLVKSDKRILSFLDSFDNASLYVAPDNYTDRYKFEKFLLRLILNN
jgi:tetratricopeptide (TPR) repeat protein